MRVLVMGATGALGYSVVQKALQAGHEVRVMVRNAGKQQFAREVSVVMGDAEDAEAVYHAVEGCDAVFYCLNVPLTDWRTKHIPLLQNTLIACDAADARLVFPGNVWVFGKGKGTKVRESQAYAPISEKGRLRMELETLIRRSGVRFTIVRLPEFYGPNVANQLMGTPFKSALQSKPLLWYGGHLDVPVEYIFIEDAAYAMVEAGLAEDVDGQTFHVPGYAATTPRQFFETIVESVHNPLPIRTLNPLLIKGASMLNQQAREWSDILHLWSDPILLDGTHYRERFGHIPVTTYREGIARTLEWFTKHPDARNTN